MNPKQKIYILKEIGEACVQLQVDVKLLLHQPKMDHFETYPNMVNLHTISLHTSTFSTRSCTSFWPDLQVSNFCTYSSPLDKST